MLREQVGVPAGGRYQVALDSDDSHFGGQGRVGHDVEHFSSPEGIPGMLLLLPDGSVLDPEQT